MFRPSARVTAPDGREWEIYAYRLALPERPRRDPIGWASTADARLGIVGGLIDAVAYLLGGVGRLAALLLWHAPRAWIGLRGSDAWTIEAVTWGAGPARLAWRTTSEYRGHVVAQVEGQLARGERPKVPHADFLGES